MPILRETNKKMHEVALHVNEFRRVAENMRRVLDIQRAVHSKPFSLVQSSRRFLFEIPAIVKSPDDPREWSSRTLYLFSDMLMYTRPPSKFNKKNTYVGHIMLSDVDIVAEGEVLRVVRRDSGEDTLLIRCRTPEERAQWTALTQRAIADAVRVKERIEGAANNKHMSLPPRTDASPPPSVLVRSTSEGTPPKSRPMSTLFKQGPLPVQSGEIAKQRASLKQTHGRFSTSITLVDLENNGIITNSYVEQPTPSPSSLLSSTSSLMSSTSPLPTTNSPSPDLTPDLIPDLISFNFEKEPIYDGLFNNTPVESEKPSL